MRVVRKTNQVVRVVGGGKSDDSKSCALLEKRFCWFALLGELSLMTQPVRVVRKTNLVVRVVGGGESDDSNS